MTFERSVLGLQIYRDPELSPRAIFYCHNSGSHCTAVRVGRDVDVEALAFDLRLDEHDHEFLKSLRVAL